MKHSALIYTKKSSEFSVCVTFLCILNVFAKRSVDNFYCYFNLLLRQLNALISYKNFL